MAERPKGYGMTAELAEKKAAKWDHELAREAMDWIGAVIEDASLRGRGDANDVQECLKDGQQLCRLINVLRPGSVQKINESKMAFKMMENIGKFLESCEAYGATKADLFQTVDLYEGQNMPQVINGIHALGRRAQAAGFRGPMLGPKESERNVREFTDQQLKEGKNVIGLQMGSNKGASQAGQTPYGLGRQIEKTNLRN